MLYVTHLYQAGKAPATIDRAMASIHYVHQAFGAPSARRELPVVEHLKRLRKLARRPTRKAPPLLPEDLRRIVDEIGDSPADVRDRAVLLLLFAGAMRRSELADLDIEDVIFKKGKLFLSIRSSKTDQAAEGMLLPIAESSDRRYCPVRALRDWLAIRPEGPRHLFCAVIYGLPVTKTRIRGHEIRRVVAKRARIAGVAPEGTEREFSAHSMRAGFITAAAIRGTSDWRIMEHSRHKSHAVFRGYVRVADPHRDHPGEGLI